MYLIVGLGNPGKQYENTRHNVGFDAVDLLVDEYRVPSSGKQHKAMYGKGVIAGQKVILAKPLTVSLFQYGKFTAFDAAMTQRALVAYSVGLMGLIVVKVLAPGFYSRQDIKTPVKIAIVTLIMTQLMNLAFIGPLKHAGLSLSIGLAACLNAGLLYWQLRKQDIFTPQPGWASFLLRLAIAVVVMAAALVGMLYVMPEWAQGTMPYRLMRLMAVVVVGVVVYFATLAVLGFKVKEFTRRTV